MTTGLITEEEYDEWLRRRGAQPAAPQPRRVAAEASPPASAATPITVKDYEEWEARRRRRPHPTILPSPVDVSEEEMQFGPSRRPINPFAGLGRAALIPPELILGTPAKALAEIFNPFIDPTGMRLPPGGPERPPLPPLGFNELIERQESRPLGVQIAGQALFDPANLVGTGVPTAAARGVGRGVSVGGRAAARGAAAARQAVPITRPLRTAAAAGKEPWQMPLAEYIDSARQWRAANMPRLTGRALEEELVRVGQTHRGVVRNALVDGKPVPSEVLGEYPDLAAQATRIHGEPQPQVSAIQSTLDIPGGPPSQGTLEIGGRIGATEPVPLIDAEEMARQAGTRARVREGQGALPEAAAQAAPPPPAAAIPPAGPPPARAITDADVADFLRTREAEVAQQSPLEQARVRLDEAQANLEVTRAPGIRAPKFGTAERAEFDAARRTASAEGRPIIPKRQQVAQAREQFRQAQQEVARLEAELPAEPIGSLPGPVGPAPTRIVPEARVDSGGRVPPPPTLITAAEQPAGAGRRFVGDLRSDYNMIAMESVGSDNPVLRGLLGRSGINPAIRQNTWAGRLVTAYARQRIAAEELTKTALAAALDTHATALLGRLPLKIHPETGLWGRTGIPWQDVFSRPQQFALTSAERSYVDDFLAVVREAEEYRVENGLRPLGMNKEGWFYVPRQVKGIRGMELERPSLPKLQRAYEEAADGFAKGVRYDADPRATLEVHLRAMYKEIIDEQLSSNTLVRSITPRELLEGVDPQVIQRHDDAVRAGVEVANRLRALQRQMRGLQIGGRETGEVGKAALVLRTARGPERVVLQRQIQQAKVELEATRNIRNTAKLQYSRAMESARRKEVAPGRLFGAYQPDEIPIRMWRNRYYPREEGEQLQRGIEAITQQRNVNVVARMMEQGADLTRFLGSVGDFAMPGIQGQAVLADNPVAWGRMVLRHEQAFLNPVVQAKLVRDHLPTYQKMAKYGVPIGDPEFFRAVEAGHGIPFLAPLEWIPENNVIGQFARKVRRGARAVAQQSVGRFQASYNTGLGYSRALVWESLEPTWKGSEAELAQYIRNLVGGLDSRALGVGPNQRAVEGMWLAFSPRFLRSTVALFADAVRPTTPQGKRSLMTLGKWVGGATGIYVISGLALGKTWEEIGTGLNPLSGKRFYSHEINGQWYGIGGQIRAILQATAGLISTLAPGGRPLESAVEFNWYENPFLQFYASRGAPGLTVGGGTAEAVVTQLSGGRPADILPYERVDDLPDLAKHLGTSAFPFALQAYLESGEEPEGRSLAPAGVEFGAGLRTGPVTERDVFESQIRRIRQEAAAPGALGGFRYGLTTPVGELRDVERRRNDIAHERYNRDYKDLPEGAREQVRDREINRRTSEQRRRETFLAEQRKKRRKELEEKRRRGLDGFTPGEFLPIRALKD